MLRGNTVENGFFWVVIDFDTGLIDVIQKADGGKREKICTANALVLEQEITIGKMSDFYTAEMPSTASCIFIVTKRTTVFTINPIQPLFFIPFGTPPSFYR